MYINIHTHTYTPCLQDHIKLIAGQGHKTYIQHIYIHTYIDTYIHTLPTRPHLTCIYTYTHTYTPCLQDRIKLIASQGHKNRHTYVHTHIHTHPVYKTALS